MVLCRHSEETGSINKPEYVQYFISTMLWLIYGIALQSGHVLWSLTSVFLFVHSTVLNDCKPDTSTETNLMQMDFLISSLLTEERCKSKRVQGCQGYLQRGRSTVLGRDRRSVLSCDMLDVTETKLQIRLCSSSCKSDQEGRGLLMSSVRCVVCERRRKTCLMACG